MRPIFRHMLSFVSATALFGVAGCLAGDTQTDEEALSQDDDALTGCTKTLKFVGKGFLAA